MLEVCEVLGDIIAFGGGRTRVNKSLWDAVPDMFKQDFEQLVSAAQGTYDAWVLDAKNRNTGEKSGSIKKRVIAEVMQPWFFNHNLANFALQKTVTKGQPKLPTEKTTIQRRTPVVDEVIDHNEVAELFDNYDWSADVFTEAPKVPDTVESNPFDFGELFLEEDGFDLSDLDF